VRPFGGAAGWLAIVALAAAQGCASYQPRRHPDFTARHPLIKTVAILPPDILAQRLTFKGDREVLYELREPLQREVMEELAAVLPKRGFTVKALDVSEPVLQEQPALRQSLHIVGEVFNKRLSEYRKHRLSPFAYSIGSEINVFADYAQSDVLIFVQAEGTRKTGGEVAKDWAKTVLLAAATLGSVVVVFSPSITVIQLAVLDGATGDLLWYTNNAGDIEFDISKPKAFRRRIRNMISRFPKAGSITPTRRDADRPPPEPPDVPPAPAAP